MTFASEWARVEASAPPSRFRRLVVASFDIFAREVRRGDSHFAKQLVESLYGGDLWLLKKAFPEEWMRSLKDKTVAFMRSEPPSFHKMVEGSPDFHRIIDLEAGKAYAFECCKHAAYCYRWNSDPLNVWSDITERWSVVKLAMGLKADEYEANTPKDGVIDRVQIVRYPPAIGFLEPHADPHLHQRLFFSGYMGRRDVDYMGGGFYTVDQHDRAVDVESYIGVGDAAIGYATMCHGVAPCDRHILPDWEKTDGRWFLSMYSNASDEVPKRHTGRPEKVMIDGVRP